MRYEYPAAPVREVDTLRGISIPPTSHTASFAAPLPEKRNAGTAIVLAMLGATLSATVGFVAVGNGRSEAPKAAAVSTATAVAVAVAPPAQRPSENPRAAVEKGQKATVIAPPPKAIPVGIVEVDAAKGARVYVDDVLFGVAPIRVTAPMGLHKVRVENAAKKGDARQVDVVFGEESQPLHVELDPPTTRATGGWTRPTTAPASAPVRSTRPAGGELQQSQALRDQAAAALGNAL